MAISKCPKCDSHSFEMKEAEPAGSKYKIMFIQCSLCGVVIGTTDYFDTASMLEKIAEKIGVNIFN